MPPFSRPATPATPNQQNRPPSTPNNRKPNGFHPGLNGVKLPNGSPKRPRNVYMGSDDEGEPSPKKQKVNGAVKDASSSAEKQAEIMKQRQQLPIWTGKDTLVKEISKHDTVVILGETGSGKTTQVPQFLHEAGMTAHGTIAITQPRRVAAISLATRVATEQHSPLGDVVGYSVRFDEKASRSTKIKYVTDGMLVRELLLDPLLSRYSVIIVDEAHERTLRTDMLLGSLKRIQRERNKKEGTKGKGIGRGPLKVVIMSATLDAERFSRFFNKCPILYIQGRQFPVKIHHTKVAQEDFVDAALKTFFQLHLSNPPGDVLIFLPGQDTIENLAKSIRTHATQLQPSKQRVLVLSLYGALPPEQQRKIFFPAPEGTRKCIIATNIAETSITIPGIRYVIDSGMCKEKSYHSRHGGSGIDELLNKPISKSSAMQRAGRAGREGEGYCFRLYTEGAFAQLKQAPIPEIQRCDLNSAILDLKCLGEDPMTFDFMDPPLQESIVGSLVTLYALKAIDKSHRVTPLGKRLAGYPLEPALALVLVSSKARACTKEILDIVSLLTSTAKLFLDSADTRDAAAAARRKFQHRDGDHLTLLNVFRSYEEVLNGASSSRKAAKEWCRVHYLNEKALQEALTIRKQLRENSERDGIDWRVSCGDEPEPVLRALLDGMWARHAVRQPDGTYRQTGSQSTIKIHPSSCLVDRKPSTIIFDELIISTAIYARGVSAVRGSWLIDTPLHASTS